MIDLICTFASLVTIPSYDQVHPIKKVTIKLTVCYIACRSLSDSDNTPIDSGELFYSIVLISVRFFDDNTRNHKANPFSYESARRRGLSH